MKPYYPIVYLFYQFIFILLISIFNDFSFDAYIILSFQIIYLVAIILMRPYNMTFKINGFLHNITIIFNHLIVITVVVMNMRWNAIYLTDNQFDNSAEFSAYFFIIIIFLIIELILTILRLIIFRK